MKSLTTDYLNSLTFSASEATTLRALGEYRGKQELFCKQSPETLKSLLLLAKVESSESSNRLEGIELPHKKIEELVLHDTTPKNRSEQEIAGYRDVLNFIHESAEHIPFTPNVILQLHSILYQHMPIPGGKWKTTDNEIIEKFPDGTQRVRFSPVKAHLAPDMMKKLVQCYNAALDNHVQDSLVLIPLSIFDFLCIHPFRDGNGRMSRLLTLLLLYQANYKVGRYISLERVFEESKESYYEVLETSSQGWHEGKHNIKPWLNYFLGALLKAYHEFEERVGVVSTIRGSKTELISTTIRRKIKPFSISEIESECPGISRDMIRKILRQLRNQGIVAPTSSGRGAMWRKM